MNSDIQAEKSRPGERSTERVILQIPIRIVSFGGSLGAFSEETNTFMVNRDGALIFLKHPLEQDATVRVINLENRREADFRVVGPARLEDRQSTAWGLECLERNRCLWDIDFPPPIKSESPNSGALLECEGCRKQSLMVLTSTEVDKLDSAATLEKLCEKCGELSTWVYVDVTRRPKPSPKSEQTIATPPIEKWDSKTERRLHKRIALKRPVLVRNHEGEEEIGRSEDISKEGLSVCLKMKLSTGDLVSVACPYSPVGQNIEQRAEVRRRVNIFADRKWVYGLRYIVIQS